MDSFLTDQKETNRLEVLPKMKNGVKGPTLSRVFGISLSEAHRVLACLLPQAIKRNGPLLFLPTFEVSSRTATGE